jgi:hypothetical protein
MGIIWGDFNGLGRETRDVPAGVEAADKREAIEKAAKRFQQDPAVLVVVRRF